MSSEHLPLILVEVTCRRPEQQANQSRQTSNPPSQTQAAPFGRRQLLRRTRHARIAETFLCGVRCSGKAIYKSSNSKNLFWSLDFPFGLFATPRRIVGHL